MLNAYVHTGGPIFTICEEARDGPACVAPVSLSEDEG
jgi:hypothetical protein